MWDTAGQDEYQAMNRNFFAGAHCVIIVFAVDSPSSFQSIETHLYNIDSYCSKDVIKILVGNKCDLESGRHINYDDMMDKGTDLNVRCFETSCLDVKRSTVDELFNEISLMLCQVNVVRNTSGSFKIKA